MNPRRIAIVMIIPLMVLALMACDGVITTGSDRPLGYSMVTPSPTFTLPALPGNGEESAYTDAQATLAAGQRELTDLDHQATMVSLNAGQAANAAVQATTDYNQRQLMELSIRGTEVSLNMARAAATQQFITEQTQMVWNAAATVESLKVTQTAQAQALLDVQSTRVAQANAAQAVYALTATPWAALQAEIVRAHDEAERRAVWDEFIVTPLRVILITLVVLLLIAGGIMAYRQLIPALELRLRTVNNDPLLLVDGMVLEPAHWVLPHQPDLPKLPGDDTPQVEIVGPDEPSVTNWITEAEQELRSDGRMQL